jgi:hypothetical protein
MVVGLHRGDEPGREVEERFADELMRLKQRGCCVLVTGSVSERVRTVQSRALFGSITEHRQRVLALTDATPAITSEYLPDGLGPEHSDVTVLDYTETVRNVTGIDPSSLEPHPSIAPSDSRESTETGTENASVIGLGETLRDSIAETIQTDLSPGELRVGVATLNALIAMDGLPSTCAFVDAVRTDLLAANGMGHVHFPGSLDDDTLAALRPVVDIHLELRESQNNPPEQRWHLLDADLTTNWIQLRVPI